MRWQAELLHYTYARVGMRSQLTALVSATHEPLRGFTCETFSVANYKSCVGKEIYEPLNKPGGISEWVRRGGPGDETVLIVDPDSAFVRPVPDPGPLRRGEACADEHDYMGLHQPFIQMVLERHCRREVRARVQPVGIYLAIQKGRSRRAGPALAAEDDRHPLRTSSVARRYLMAAGSAKCWDTRSRQRRPECGTASVILRRRPDRGYRIGRSFTTVTPSIRADGTGRKNSRSRSCGANMYISHGSTPRWRKRQRLKDAPCCSAWRSWQLPIEPGQRINRKIPEYAREV